MKDLLLNNSWIESKSVNHKGKELRCIDRHDFIV